MLNRGCRQKQPEALAWASAIACLRLLPLPPAPPLPHAALPKCPLLLPLPPPCPANPLHGDSPICLGPNVLAGGRRGPLSAAWALCSPSWPLAASSGQPSRGARWAAAAWSEEEGLPGLMRKLLHKACLAGLAAVQ